jgi:hypothetical protein
MQARRQTHGVVLRDPHLDLAPTNVDGAETIVHHLDVELSSADLDRRVGGDDAKALIVIEMNHRDVNLAVGHVDLLIWRPPYLLEMGGPSCPDDR